MENKKPEKTKQILRGKAKEFAGRAAKMIDAEKLATNLRELPKRGKERFNLSEWTKEQRKTFVGFALVFIVIMIVAAVITFFFVLKGAEQIMVPDVRGMELPDALVKLQERELYPRVALRFTDKPADKDTILEQSPAPGSIVKAGRRINLTVSKGAVLDHIENYVGQDLDTVKLHLQALFAASHPLITIRDPPMYIFDKSAAGTIVDQKPMAGTEISGPTILELVVSKGPENTIIKVPDFMKLSTQDAIQQAETSPLTVDFQLRSPKAGEKQGVVVEESPATGTEVKNGTRINLVLTTAAPSQGTVNGLYMYTLPLYPYPVQVKLEALRPSGQRVLLYSLKHPGGSFSVPFSLPDHSTLILSVQDNEVSRTEVNR
jgi:beta-lactam-binding protein with PASTA domain